LVKSKGSAFPPIQFYASIIRRLRSPRFIKAIAYGVEQDVVGIGYAKNIVDAPKGFNFPEFAQFEGMSGAQRAEGTA
jgi:hypothetical protein